jgi:hypothetical protein
MSDKTKAGKSTGEKAETTTERQPVRMRLPGFVKDDDIGLGDFVMRVTSSAGIKPCGGCHRRAAWLNSRFHITGR